MSPYRLGTQGFFTPEDYRQSRDFLRGQFPLPAPTDRMLEQLLVLGGYLFEQGDPRFADWIHKIYEEVGVSARPHVEGIWRRLPAQFESRFELAASLGITSVERTRLVLLSRELVADWRSSEAERQLPGGMMHDHYCSTCGSECSEDFEDCVMGTSTQCDECRSKELHGHTHTCPICKRSWSCHSVSEDMSETPCGDCTAVATRHEVGDRFSSLWLMSALSTLGVTVGFLQMPYTYYSILRFALCVTACFGLAVAAAKDKRAWICTFALCAIVYNPLFPIHLRRKTTWEVVNLASLLAFWTGEYVLKPLRRGV